jgi:hypothetical protein
MPQPHKRGALTVPLHVLCPNCCCPTHLTTAHVTADGAEKIRFECDKCGAATIRECVRSY